MNCCAVQELHEIGEKQSPEDVLREVCKRFAVPAGPFGQRAYFVPSAFYIFTAWVTNGNRYGHQLAAYIKEHKLGPVVVSVARKNRVNEPTHTVQVWTWAPDLKPLKAWYGKHKEK